MLLKPQLKPSKSVHSLADSNLECFFVPTMVKMSLLVVVMVAVMWSSASAQSNSCTNVLISLSPCLNYISGNSSKPSSSCCSQLATVVGAQPECLCQVLNGGAPGLNINQTQAMALPAACNVNTPSLSNCNTAGSPAGAPDGSPPTVPSTDKDGSSDGSVSRMSSYLVLAVVMAASYVSTFSA